VRRGGHQQNGLLTSGMPETLTVHLTDDGLALLDAWIKRHPWAQTRDEALAIIVDDVLNGEQRVQLRERKAPVVAFSGQSRWPRSSFIAQAEEHGWRTQGSLSASVHVLVIGEGHSETKVRRAKKLGVSVISYEEWAERMITGELSR